MDRAILHSDINCCYASIEHLYRPELNNKPLAVGGNPEERHGIILTADYLSRRYGVKTGMPFWQAKKLCPDITIVTPRMELYKRFSNMAHEIYGEYTNLIEPYGIDEAWLDVTASCSLHGDGERIAREINARMKNELGITDSIGVSWNKIFAKLGSDYKKPDAVTIFTREYLELIRSLPVGDLLYVGKSTHRKLNSIGIYTIGHAADTPENILKSHLGKMGTILKRYACGLDDSPVSSEDECIKKKSIGNSVTTMRDLCSIDDIKIVIYTIAESVASRLKESGYKGRVVEVWVRNNQLKSFVRQCHTNQYTNISDEIANTAFELFRTNYDWSEPVRSLGIRVTEIVDCNEPEQLTLFDNAEQRNKKMSMDTAVDSIRRRFGESIINRGVMYTDRKLSHLSDKDTGLILRKNPY